MTRLWNCCDSSWTANAPRPHGWNPSAIRAKIGFRPSSTTARHPSRRAHGPEARCSRAREALDGQVAVLRKQIGETLEEAKALGDQIAAEERAIKLQKDELAINEKLLKDNFVQKTRLMALERAVAEYEARWGEHRAELAKTRQRSSELELRILSMRNAYMQTPR